MKAGSWPISVKPDVYYCVEKMNDKLETTICGPNFSMYYMLSDLLEFDIEFISYSKVSEWNKDIIAKVRYKYCKKIISK